MSHQSTKKHFDFPFVAFPHWFTRQVLPHIRTVAQIKILAAIIDQQFGYHKQADCTTFSALSTQIGLSRDAITNNIQPLLDAGLVAALDTNMRPLDTPEKRQINGNAKLPMFLAVPKEVALTQDMIRILSQPVTRKRRVSLTIKDTPQQDTATNPTNSRHTNRNNSKERKEIINSKPKKFDKHFQNDCCQKCGKPMEGMDRTKSIWNHGKPLCNKCQKIAVSL